jgi:hypothetical protein
VIGINVVWWFGGLVVKEKAWMKDYERVEMTNPINA